MSLIDIAFPYRRKRAFGAASFALTFLALFIEIELLTFVGVTAFTRQVGVWWDLQPQIVPVSCLVSLSAAIVFWWRARTWTRQRVDTLNAWARGGVTFGQELAEKRKP